MVLRILGSPRFTNDLDYVFVPYKSKKDIVAEVVGCLESIEGATVTHSLNSKCLRVVLTVDDTTIQVEAKVALEAKTSMASTRLVSRTLGLPPRMVYITDHAEALANKLAAWNECRLIRDLYDAWFFLQMGVMPDMETLELRLRKPAYSRLVAKEDWFSGQSVPEFFGFVREHAARLSDDDIEAELADYLPSEELVGLGPQISAALVKLR